MLLSFLSRQNVLFLHRPSHLHRRVGDILWRRFCELVADGLALFYFKNKLIKIGYRSFDSTTKQVILWRNRFNELLKF